MDQPGSNRDYSSISPSAKLLLLMKGYTHIPFARQAAELIVYPEKYIPDHNKKDLAFWARTLHFENRYFSIDQLQADIPVTNILELSSGFSFRGLKVAEQQKIHYIDTDLPNVISIKKDIVAALEGKNKIPKEVLELLPLNALDENQFDEVVSHFISGSIVILNEGLLMYLNLEEKEKLCRIIHKTLTIRGGYWITADIYIKRKPDSLPFTLGQDTKAFFEQHHIEENKFGSFEEAEDFFDRMGFAIDKEANVDRSQLSSFEYFLKAAGNKLDQLGKTGKIHTTWRLKVKDK
jgi:O-methyltransferase involved in polyketide biosynthesis